MSRPSTVATTSLDAAGMSMPLRVAGMYRNTKESTTRPRLHLSQFLCRRIRSSIVIAGVPFAPPLAEGRKPELSHAPGYRPLVRRLDQSAVLRPEHQLEAPVHLHLFIDIVQVNLHRALGDGEPLADDAVAQALRHHLDDFRFPRRQH